MAPTLRRAAARAKRWEVFAETFPAVSEMRVLDLGGEVDAWLKSPVRPAQVVLLNLPEAVEIERTQLREAGSPSWLEPRAGDACAAAASLGGERFDLVYSNSVIEHVGGRNRRMEFADSAREVADRHWIQTPYRYFPIEPHMYGPGFQFLPIRLRAAVIRGWPMGNLRRPGTTLTERIEAVTDIEMLDRTEFQWYFPDSRIESETVLGMTKSLVAVR